MRVLLCTHTYTISAPSAQPEPHLRSDAIIVPSPLHHMQNSCRSISEREPYPETKVQKPTNVAIAHFCQQIRGRRDDILVNVIHKSRQRQTQSKNSLYRWNTSDHQARIYCNIAVLVPRRWGKNASKAQAVRCRNESRCSGFVQGVIITNNSRNERVVK